MEGLDLRWRGGGIRSGLGKSQADIRLSSDINEETKKNVAAGAEKPSPRFSTVCTDIFGVSEREY